MFLRPDLQDYVGEIMFLTPKLGCIVTRCWGGQYMSNMLQKHYSRLSKMDETVIW